MLRSLRTHHLQWQMSWRHWGLSHHADEAVIPYGGVYFDHVLCVGPLQMRWRSSRR